MAHKIIRNITLPTGETYQLGNNSSSPFFFGMYQYVECDPQNPAWLVADGTFQDGEIYSHFYNWLAGILAGTTVIDGISVKASDATDINDYDFVVATADNTFRLPLVTRQDTTAIVAGLKLCFYVGDANYDSKTVDFNKVLKAIEEQRIMSNYEIGDIGIAPLGIDEAQNKRRYLNGQVVSADQFKTFVNKVLERAKTYPSILCEESDYVLVDGQFGKFAKIMGAGEVAEQARGAFTTEGAELSTDRSGLNVTIPEFKLANGTVIAESIVTTDGSSGSGFGGDEGISDGFGSVLRLVDGVWTRDSISIADNGVYFDDPMYRWGGTKTLAEINTTAVTANTIFKCSDNGFAYAVAPDGTVTKEDNIYFIYDGTNLYDFLEVVDSSNVVVGIKLPTVTDIKGLTDLAFCGMMTGAYATGTDGTVVQYPYFIQVANGVEESEDATLATSIVTPFYFGQYVYTEITPNNASWLISNGQYNDSAVYPDFYAWLVGVQAGNIASNASVVTDATTATDFDFVINTADGTFRLPIKTATELNTVTGNEDIELYFYVGETVQDANVINAGQILTTVAKLANKKCMVPTANVEELSTETFTGTKQFTAPANGFITAHDASAISIVADNGMANSAVASALFTDCYVSLPVYAGCVVTVNAVAGCDTVKFIYAE